MPEPISSSILSRSTCDVEDEGSLSCESPSPSAPSSPAGGGNACLPLDLPVEAAASSDSAASLALAQKFLRTDQATFVAAPAPSSAAPPARGWELAAHDALLHRERHAALGALQLSASVELNSVDVHLGSRNEDGSYGANVAVSRSLVEGKVTADYHGWSLTIGASGSVGGSISSGEGRDIDGDGVRERCFQMSLGSFTLGECDEL